MTQGIRIPSEIRRDATSGAPSRPLSNETMRTRTPSPTTLRRADPRDAHQPAGYQAIPRGEQRAREAGGPQDHAFYACSCGHAFAEDVTTHVACPKCGGEQSW